MIIMERLLLSSTHLVFSVLQVLNIQVSAATSWGDCARREVNGKIYEEVASIQCLVPLFRNVISGLVQLAGIGLLLMFIIGGYQFIMSGGNPKQLEQAKHTLTYAIIGVVVIVSAFLILRLVSQFTGVDVTTFSIPE